MDESWIAQITIAAITALAGLSTRRLRIATIDAEGLNEY